MFWKYFALSVIVLGIVMIFVFVMIYPPINNLISAWVLYSVLSVSIVLPLVGLGIGLSLVNIRLVFISSIFFLLAFFFALINYNKIWMFFTDSVSSLEHLYLTIPISSLCSGLLLILPDKIRKWIVVLVAGTIGGMLAITIKLTDPTLHDPLIPKLGLFIAMWIILSFIFFTKSFYRSWFYIPIRIFGSWLLAGAILYGGTIFAMRYGVIIPKNKPLKPIKENVTPQDILIPEFTQNDLVDTLLNKKKLCS